VDAESKPKGYESKKQQCVSPGAFLYATTATFLVS